MISSIGLDSKEKIRLTFLRLFDNPLPKCLAFKRISCMEWLFCVINQNKTGGLGLTFGAHFPHNFSIKMSLILSIDIYLRISFKIMADRGKKKGRQKHKYLNISRTKRAF